MRMAIHPEGRLVSPNDLHHVQGIECRRERAAFVFGVGIDDRCIMADNHARTAYILPEPVQQFRREVVMQGSGVDWTEACSVGIAYQPEVIHLILGGFHGA